MFGDDDRAWEDAHQWNYVSAGGAAGGVPLQRLQPAPASLCIIRTTAMSESDESARTGPAREFTARRRPRDPATGDSAQNDNIKEDADDRALSPRPSRMEWTVPAGQGSGTWLPTGA
jgi:hypothetical protein